MTGLDLYDGITLHQGDCRDIMRTYPDQHFDAVITDPPYGIAFAGEKWDTATPHGFQSWAQSWGEEALRVLKPGGYLLAFSAPRTYHRLTSGLEDAGFEIRDAMAWIRADGKPAGMDISSAFDRAAGVLDQREGRVIERWDTSDTATDMSNYKTNATYSGAGYGPNLHEVATALLPTPKAADGVMGLPRASGRPPEKSTHLATRLEYTDYGDYAPAIARWEKVTGRAAPPPTTPPRREGGKPQLSARFVEWMMGLPEGHVTGPDLDLSRERQLRMLGNGVVPQQAALAVSSLLQIDKGLEDVNI